MAAGGQEDHEGAEVLTALTGRSRVHCHRNFSRSLAWMRPSRIGAKMAPHAKAERMEAIVLLHVIAAGSKDPSILALAVLLLVIAFRQELGNWIGRKFFGNRRR